MKTNFLTAMTMVTLAVCSVTAYGQTNTNKVNITNNGGRQIDVDSDNDGTTDYSWWASSSSDSTSSYMSIDTSDAGFNLFAIGQNTPTNMCWLTGPNRFGGMNVSGLGLGTSAPQAPLHIQAGQFSPLGSNSAGIRLENLQDGVTPRDDKMVDMINFGGVFMNFMDTSQTPASNWQMYTKRDWFYIRKFSGNINPQIQLRQNGDFSVATNPSAPGGGGVNFTVKGATGDIFYRGRDLTSSDKNLKENFTTVDTEEILEKVANLPITKWNYIHDQKDTTCIGPMAQDFYAAFGLGDSDKVIAGGDKDGIALAAIQGLNKKVESKQQEIDSLKQQLERLAERLEKLEQLTTPAQD